MALANGHLRRLAVRWKFEDADYHRCWHRSHAHCRRWRHGHTPLVRKPNPNLNPATFTGVILPEAGQFLLLCHLQLWQQLQRCPQTRATVPLFLIHFTSVLGKQLATNDMLLREVNKRALALRNSRRIPFLMPPVAALGCRSSVIYPLNQLQDSDK